MYYFFDELMEQSFFNYQLKPNFSENDFFVGNSNIEAYNLLINNKNNNNIFLIFISFFSYELKIKIHEY